MSKIKEFIVIWIKDQSYWVLKIGLGRSIYEKFDNFWIYNIVV